jgi:hypothetical protein
MENEKHEEDKAREPVRDELSEQMETTNPAALREAARRGEIDRFMVKTDLEDLDQRDGRPSPMANADNQEKP